MKFSAFKSLAFLVMFGVFSFHANAVGLQDYLQNTDALTQTDEIAGAASNQLTKIIELVVAGIVASALIISVLVLFLGRWIAKKEKKIIKDIRIEVEDDQDHITSATTTIREQEKESTKIIHDMRDHATEFSVQKKVANQYKEEIIAASESIKKQEQDFTDITTHVSDRLGDIQTYWDDQLKETVATISHVQQSLDNNLGVIDESLNKMNDQKLVSQELLQDFLGKHSDQEKTLKKNTKLSQKVSLNLESIYEESSQLINLLKKHQKEADKSLKHYETKLSSFEEQAYEQFDTSFQVADLARQELTANIDESHKHIETMRRQEEQSHNLTNQTMKNLESLDYSKIIRISNTLDSTQDTFDEIHHKVENTRQMLEELKQIKSDIEETVDEPEQVRNEIAEAKTENSEGNDDNNTVAISDYKIASGDGTPLSFFKNIKQKEK